MNIVNKYILRCKIILSISFLFLISSIAVFVCRNTNHFFKEDYTLAYETINIKTMGAAQVSLKKKSKDSVFSTIVSKLEKNSNVTEVALAKHKKGEENLSPSPSQVEKSTWRMPTERGYITQYSHRNHVALDITSSRGTNERIYPVADGEVTSIFHDNYGAKIVTVNHYINGKYYTSQYVHLSWFAKGLHVGQKVTTDTVLGGMGATGIATGIHLHLTVMDCNLYSPNDPNCSNLGQFYNYARIRLSQGFKGLDTLRSVPYSWYSR